MKKIFMATIAALLLAPFPAGWQAAQAAVEAPPVAQPLVREGDLAMGLVGVFELGSAEDEAQAERMLADLGIAPQGGWASDYPVTPEVIGQLQQTIAEAADAQKLPLGREAALDAFKGLVAELGLALSPGRAEGYAAETPPEAYPGTVDPETIDDYYYRAGPPVITYYVPPPAYYPLYSWVYYPFWYSGSFFSGYFILHSFDRVVPFRHRNVIISNHRYPHKYPRVHRGPGRFERHEREFRSGRRSYYGKEERDFESRHRERHLFPEPKKNPAGRREFSGQRRNPPAVPLTPQLHKQKRSESGKTMAAPRAPQPHDRRPKTSQRRDLGLLQPKSGPAAPPGQQVKRSESLRHRGFGKSERRALEKPIRPRPHREGAASFSRPSNGGGGFTGRSGGGHSGFRIRRPGVSGRK